MSHGAVDAYRVVAVLHLSSISGLAQRQAEDDDPDMTQVAIDPDATQVDPDATVVDPDAITILEEDMLPATPFEPQQHIPADTGRQTHSDPGTQVIATTVAGESMMDALIDSIEEGDVPFGACDPDPDPDLESHRPCPHSLGEGCCVCLEPFEQEVVKGCAVCMKMMHVRCFASWQAACAARGRHVTCPLCRGRSFWRSAAHQ